MTVCKHSSVSQMPVAIYKQHAKPDQNVPVCDLKFLQAINKLILITAVMAAVCQYRELSPWHCRHQNNSAVGPMWQGVGMLITTYQVATCKPDLSALPLPRFQNATCKLQQLIWHTKNSVMAKLTRRLINGPFSFVLLLSILGYGCGTARSEGFSCLPCSVHMRRRSRTCTFDRIRLTLLCTLAQS